MQMSTSSSLKGPSIKYVRTLFAIFWHPLPHVNTFFYLSVIIFFSIFGLSPQKKYWRTLWMAPNFKGMMRGEGCCLMLRNIYGVRFSMCEICMYCCLHNKDTKVYWVLWRWDIYSQIFKEILLCVFLHLVKFRYSEIPANICPIFHL